MFIYGGTLAVTGAMVLDANRGLAAGTGTNTINVATGATLSYGGIIANSTASPGGLVKTGSGILDLSGSSTFSGGLTSAGRPAS